jgi:ribonuclease HI
MYMIYCDSSIEPFNPDGILSWAFVVKKGGKIIHQDVAISGWGKGTTNNQGEYQAVVGALLWLVSLPKKQQLPAVVHSDSQLIINQCCGSWGCHDEKLQQLLELVNRAKTRYKKSIFFKWIPREQNTEADALSRTLYTEEAIAVMKRQRVDALFEDDDIPF